MGAECNKCIQSALQLADQMLALANEGDAIRTDVGCGVFFGVLRDCAYKIRMLAESEMKVHSHGR
ncbi:MAG: hypothetical protein JW810_07655 [Sedimentisphaerales bacterium]|nr:hypothetical protein [Sedimentisphaerales bacterium]